MSALIRILFPDYCLRCDRYGSLLCDRCVWELPPAPRTEYRNIAALLSYRNDTTERLLKIMKSRELPDVAHLLGQRMAQESIELLSEYHYQYNFQSPIVIPIPQTAARHRERGYNHAELLARGFCAHYPESSAQLRNDILIKVTSTHKQALVANRAERFENIHNSFAIQHTDDIQGACVIVIDDITTTGATLCAAHDQLISAGARIVLCLAVAH